MCSRDDDPTQHVRPIAPSERAAVATYANGLDRWAAKEMGQDPDLICSACGYVSHDDPTSADNAHDNLCCGGVGVCHDLARYGRMCATHDTMPSPEAFE